MATAAASASRELVWAGLGLRWSLCAAEEAVGGLSLFWGEGGDANGLVGWSTRLGVGTLELHLFLCMCPIFVTARD